MRRWYFGTLTARQGKVTFGKSIMGSRDQFEDITEPLKVEGVTADESNVDDHVNETKDKEPRSKEYEKENSEASIHLVVDDEVLNVPNKNRVKESFKFIQICDTGSNPNGKPMLNGHIPSKTPKDAQKDKDDIPMQDMVLKDKQDPEGSQEWRASKIARILVHVFPVDGEPPQLHGQSDNSW